MSESFDVSDLPDLTLGVAEQLVRDGESFLGRVGEEAVLLVRDGDDVHAFSASCTHYGGPLHEGIVTDGQIRCPWHHACFSTRTGEVLAPPALNPLARWEVQRENGKVVVGHKLPTPDPLQARSAPATDVRHVVIVGAGAAGASAAESLRAFGFKGVITMIDPDPDAPCDRPNLSKDYLAGNAPEEWLPLRPPDFHAQHGIRRLFDVVTTIDPRERVLTTRNGERMSYDALLLATGAVPIRPPIPGADQPHVHVLRSVADCKSLIAALEPGKRVLIAGASFIGLEAAASLRNREADVTVVAPEKIPFAQVLGPTIGGALHELHKKHGVRFKLGRKLSEVRADSVVLDDNSIEPADVVLLAVGVKPDVRLAESAGIETKGGVLVNEYLETSVPRIYAAGDIARYPDPYSGRPVRIEHWVVAQRQGRAAAANILGLRQPFTSVPFFWTTQYDMTINYVGHAEDFSHIQVDGSPQNGDFSAAFMSGDKLLAFVSVGRDRESLKVERELELGIQQR